MKKFSDILEENKNSVDDFITINMIDKALDDNAINEGFFGKIFAIIGGLIAAGIAGMAKLFKWMLSDTESNIKQNGGHYVVKDKAIENASSGKNLDKIIVGMMDEKQLNKFLDITKSTDADGPFYMYYKEYHEFDKRASDNIKLKETFQVLYEKYVIVMICVTSEDEKLFTIEFITFYKDQKIKNKKLFNTIKEKMEEILESSFDSYEMLSVRTKNAYEYFDDLKFDKKKKLYLFGDSKENKEDDKKKIEEKDIDAKEISYEDFEKISANNDKLEDVSKSLTEYKELKEKNDNIKIAFIGLKDDDKSMIYWSFVYKNEDKVDVKNYKNEELVKNLSDDAAKYIKDEYKKIFDKLSDELKEEKIENNDEHKLSKEIIEDITKNPEKRPITLIDIDTDDLKTWCEKISSDDAKTKSYYDKIVEYTEKNKKFAKYKLQISTKLNEDKSSDKNLATIGILFVNDEKLKEENKISLERLYLVLEINTDTMKLPEKILKDYIEPNLKKSLNLDDKAEIVLSKEVKSRFDIKEENTDTSEIDKDFEQTKKEIENQENIDNENEEELKQGIKDKKEDNPEDKKELDELSSDIEKSKKEIEEIKKEKIDDDIDKVFKSISEIKDEELINDDDDVNTAFNKLNNVKQTLYRLFSLLNAQHNRIIKFSKNDDLDNLEKAKEKYNEINKKYKEVNIIFDEQQQKFDEISQKSLNTQFKSLYIPNDVNKEMESDMKDLSIKTEDVTDKKFNEVIDELKEKTNFNLDEVLKYKENNKDTLVCKIEVVKDKKSYVIGFAFSDEKPEINESKDNIYIHKIFYLVDENKLSKKCKESIKKSINDYFENNGYQIAYIPEDVAKEIEGNMKNLSISISEIKENDFNEIIKEITEKSNYNVDEIVQYQKDHSDDDIFSIEVKKEKNKYKVGFIFIGDKINEADSENLEIYFHQAFTIFDNEPGKEFKKQVKKSLESWAKDSGFKIVYDDKKENYDQKFNNPEEDNTEEQSPEEVKNEIEQKSEETKQEIENIETTNIKSLDDNEDLNNDEVKNQKEEIKQLTDEQKKKIDKLKQECNDKIKELESKHEKDRKGHSMNEYDEILKKQNKELENIKKEYEKKIKNVEDNNDIVDKEQQEKDKKELDKLSKKLDEIEIKLDNKNEDDDDYMDLMDERESQEEEFDKKSEEYKDKYGEEYKKDKTKKESSKEIKDNAKRFKETPKEDKKEKVKKEAEDINKEAENIKKEVENITNESENPYKNISKNLEDKLNITLAEFISKQEEFNKAFNLWKEATINKDEAKAKEYEKQFNLAKKELEIIKIELNKNKNSLKSFKTTTNVIDEELDTDNLDWKLSAWFNRDSKQKDLFNRVLNDPSTLELALTDGFDMQGLVNFTYDNINPNEEINYIYQLEQLIKFLKDKK